MLWNWDTVDACFISSSWKILDNGMMAASCVGVVFLVVVLEALRWMGKQFDNTMIAQMKRQGNTLLASRVASSISADDEKYNSDASQEVFSQSSGLRTIKLRVSPVQQFLRAVLHAVIFGVAYVIIMLAMYFNGYIIISIILGAGLGKFLCDWLSVVVSMDDRDGSPNAEPAKKTTCAAFKSHMKI